MHTDPTEAPRRAAVAKINSNPMEREDLEKIYGKDNVWDTGELTKQFRVQGFMAPFAVVIRKSTGEQGAVTFQHQPRYYFDFQPA